MVEKRERWTRWGTKPPAAATAPVTARLVESAASIVGANLQTRCFKNAATVETRSGMTPGRIIRGLAIPYNVMTEDLGSGLREMYAAGSFRDSITRDDIGALRNGNVSQVLGRTSAGTLRVWEDRDGVRFECDAPETSYANDLLISMRRGDVSDAGGLFYALKSEVRAIGGDRVRVVTQAKLLAVAITSFSTLGGAIADAAIEAARSEGFKAGRKSMRNKEQR